MRRLRRAQQRDARESKKFRRGVVTAGTAAVITLGAGFALNRSIAANVPDRHQLPVKQDMDGDFLADREEFAIGYKPFVADQNRNGTPDGLELATRCAAIIAQLPWQDDAAPGATCKWHAPQFGLETCEICGQTVNMGPATIVNPHLGVEVKCPLIAMHYMEHGSFNYAGDVQRGRIDVPALMRALELRFPGEPDEHQLPVSANDLDGDLLTDNEELAAGYNLYDADQDEDLTPDGIELATQCAQVIEALPVHEPNEPGVGELYKASFMQRGIELCEICGESVNMGYWQVINPRLSLSINVPDIVCHYMRHGSFGYWGNLHGKGRIDVALLAIILEMPRRCGDLGTIFAPTDLNQDCKTDLADLAKLAQKWLESTDPNLIIEDDREDSYSCTGDTSQLTAPCSNAVDENWWTKVAWDTTPVGDYNVNIIEDFIIPGSITRAKWEFKAYHRNAGALMPKAMYVYYWNGSAWKQLYALDDQEHKNEIFIEALDVPSDALSGDRLKIKTQILYSSHVTGAGIAEQLWHYTEYFEGKVIWYR